MFRPPALPVRLACAVAIASIATACGIRQAVYVPQGYQEVVEDGSYFHDESGVTVRLPVLVVNKSDITLHPSITIEPHDHEVHVASARWRLNGRDIAPVADVDNGKVIDAREPLDLHWNIQAMGKAVKVLGDASSILLSLRVDGQQREIEIDLKRRDHF